MDTDLTCTVMVMTMGSYAEVIKLGIEGGLMEDVPATIGEPPAEITTLVQETLSAAEEASVLQKTAYDECSEATDDCHSAGAAGWLAMDSLIRKLNAWKPYM